MLTSTEILSLAERKYPEFLKSIVTGEPFFPRRIRFGKPCSTDDLRKLVREVAELNAGNVGYTIECVERNTRKWGKQSLPDQVRFDTESQYLTAIKKGTEAQVFRDNVNLTLARIPQLRDWVISHVNWVDKFASEWSGMIAVCEYFLAHPRPNLYIRELPIEVHTKFIENNQQVLSSLLSFLLPREAILEGATFEKRFGLKTCEPLIRIRALDESLLLVLGISHPDIGLPVTEFSK